MSISTELHSHAPNVVEFAGLGDLYLQIDGDDVVFWTQDDTSIVTGAQSWECAGRLPVGRAHDALSAIELTILVSNRIENGVYGVETVSGILDHYRW